jgi:hypothetical protein
VQITPLSGDPSGILIENSAGWASDGSQYLGAGAGGPNPWRLDSTLDFPVHAGAFDVMSAPEAPTQIREPVRRFHSRSSATTKRRRRSRPRRAPDQAVAGSDFCRCCCSDLLDRCDNSRGGRLESDGSAVRMHRELSLVDSLSVRSRHRCLETPATRRGVNGRMGFRRPGPGRCNRSQAAPPAGGGWRIATLRLNARIKDS